MNFRKYYNLPPTPSLLPLLRKRSKVAGAGKAMDKLEWLRVTSLGTNLAFQSQREPLVTGNEAIFMVHVTWLFQTHFRIGKGRLAILAKNYFLLCVC